MSVGGVDGQTHTLTMFNSVIMKVVDGVAGSDLKKRLLSASAMRYNVDKGDIVYSVQKL